MLVTHATPGARLEVRVANNLVGAGLASRHGEACVGVDLRRARAGDTLAARQLLWRRRRPTRLRTLASLPPLPRPVLGDPIFGCQSRVPVSGVRPGARLTFETDGGDNLGSVCSCWSAVNVNVVRPLAVGERVRANCVYASQVCDEIGPWSDWRLVAPPDERIKPEVLEALIEGDQVDPGGERSSAGASLLVRIADGAGPPGGGVRPSRHQCRTGDRAWRAAGRRESRHGRADALRLLHGIRSGYGATRDLR